VRVSGRIWLWSNVTIVVGLVALKHDKVLSGAQPPEGDVMSDGVPLFEEAVASLTRYFVGDQTLGETLHQVAELTTQGVTVADHVGITLLVDGKLKTSVFTHPEVPTGTPAA
jgi:hypothetical protein